MKNSKHTLVLVVVAILAIIVGVGYIYMRKLSPEGEVILSGQTYGPLLFSKNEDRLIYTIQKDPLDPDSEEQYLADSNFNKIETLPKGSRSTYYECSPQSKKDYLCSLETTNRLGCYANPDGSMCIYIERGPVFIGETPLFYSLYLKKDTENKLLYRGEEYPRGYWSRDNHVYIIVPAHSAKQQIIRVY